MEVVASGRREDRRRGAFGRVCLAGWLGLLAAVWGEPATGQQQGSVYLPNIDVIAPSPLSGSTARSRRAPAAPTPANAPPPAAPEPRTNDAVGIDRDKIAASTQTLTAEDIARSYSSSITDTLMQRVPGVSVTDVQGNGFTQDLRYRGFAASPLQGTPQGLAVYMSGIRVNEAFGDTVNWDLIPTNAINRVDLWTNNPTFGLNALGGAVNIQMKNGFTYSGAEIEGLGGSYGRVSGSAQYGKQKDGVGLYIAAQGVKVALFDFNVEKGEAVAKEIGGAKKAKDEDRAAALDAKAERRADTAAAEAERANLTTRPWGWPHNWYF